MDNTPFRELLDLFMVSDPWPLGEESHETVRRWLDAVAKKRGYADWVEAYHRQP